MVVFTCNHCGESLQKPRVAKHYQTICKNPISLTCVDCLKDFRLEEYVAHTKCVSEKERYSAKGTVATIEKGVKKQTEWMEIVTKVIEEELKKETPLKNLFQAMVGYQNVPKKKKTFVNFLRNVCGLRVEESQCAEVWQILENYSRKIKQEIQSNENKKRKMEDTNIETNNKKTKIKETAENGVNGTTELENGNETSEKPKKKKNKKRKQEDEAEVPEKKAKCDETNEETKSAVEDSEKSSKKKKKSKQNKENTSEANKTEETIAAEKVEVENTEKSSKKKNKLKQKPEDATKEESKQNENNKNTVQIKLNKENIPAEKKSKKKKKEESQIFEENHNEKKKQSTENGNTEIKEEQFSWLDTLLNILRENPEGISKDKLEKKTLKKYTKLIGPIENQGKVIKKFNRKLKSYPEIIQDDKLVKLAK